MSRFWVCTRSIDRLVDWLNSILLRVDLVLQINSASSTTVKRESVLYPQSLFQSPFDLFCFFKMHFIPLIAHYTLPIPPASLHSNTSIAQHADSPFDHYFIWEKKNELIFVALPRI